MVVALMAMSSVFAAPAAIWTTTGGCGDDQQDVNHYSVGESVWINGKNFDADTYAWQIAGQPGGASCDPKSVVSSGNVVVGAGGTFCFNAYTVLPGDCGEYSVDVGNKNDNYRVDVIVEVPVCGNGVVENTEECDDGNTADGDGCSANCTVEEPENDVPEFGVIGAGMLLAGAGAYMYRKRK